MDFKFNYFNNVGKEKKNRIVPEYEIIKNSHSFDNLVNIFEFNCLSRRKVVAIEFINNKKYIDIIIKELLRAKDRMDNELKADLQRF
jgi:hypothetical protein